MKTTKLLCVALCLGFSLMASAQDKQWTITTSYTTQAQSGNPLTNAYDGNTSTYWHTPWSGGSTSFPVTITFGMDDVHHVDFIRYTPRQDGNSNGNWKEVIIQVNKSTNVKVLSGWVAVDTVNFGGSGSASEVVLGKNGMDSIGAIRFKIKSGQGNYASASEIGFFQYDNSKSDAFKPYFEDNLFTKLKSTVTTSEGIEDADVKTLVDNLLKDAEGYKKFHVGEFEAYRTTSSLQTEMRTNSQYCKYENPTGIYATKGKAMIIMVEGIDANYPVKLSVKQWLRGEDGSSYALRNGMNFITPTTTGNTFINYYTDDFKNAPNVRAHLINGQVQGYFDLETMDNNDWKAIMALHPSTSDSTIVICRSAHAQTAFPAFIYRKHCPEKMVELMTNYENVEKAMHYMMGVEKYGREIKNRQLFYATNYGFMAAGGEGAFCHVGSLGDICKPDASSFGIWGVAHEWGHNNQITPGFKWSGCGETTNNIYASWAQIMYGTPNSLRLEDEVTGVNDYSGMRGGRMQVYFEEGLRKGVQWQLQDGPDYHGATPSGDNKSRNYDHFVKLVPFWQLNLWGTLAGKCPDIIPMVIEGIRNTSKTTLQSMDNGKMQVNWMKMACDSAKLDLLPFFEKAGMLKEINAYIEDYAAGWNKITKAMITTLKKHVADKGYPAITEEINFVNGHNYTIYRDKLKLQVPTTKNDGCTLSGSKVKVLHSKVKNAVAYETYNAEDSLIRITMYGLGSDANHTYTQVLYPSAEGAAYIMAVGYDGERKKVFEYEAPVFKKGKFYSLLSKGKGGYMTTENCKQNTTGAASTWDLSRNSSFAATKAAQIWYAEDDNNKLYLYNPQANAYVGGSSSAKFTQLYAKENAVYFVAEQVAANGTWTFARNGSSQYLNSYSSTETGYYSGGSGDLNNVWGVTEVTSINISIPSLGYRAINYPFGLEIPEEVTVYIPTSLKTVGDTTYVLMHKSTNRLASNTPAILYTGSAEGVACKLFADYNEVRTEEQPLLMGTTLPRTGYTSGDLMGLGKNSTTQKVGFNASTTKTTTANYAYLLSADAKTSAGKDVTTTVLILEDDPRVGIEEVNSFNTDLQQGLYNLSGQQITKTQRGQVYLHTSGKKIIIR